MFIIQGLIRINIYSFTSLIKRDKLFNGCLNFVLRLMDKAPFFFTWGFFFCFFQNASWKLERWKIEGIKMVWLEAFDMHASHSWNSRKLVLIWNLILLFWIHYLFIFKIKRGSSIIASKKWKSKSTKKA